MTVIDTNTNCLHSIEVLRARGVTAVGRYYRVVHPEWRLTRPEAQKLSAAGIQLFTVYEDRGRNLSLTVAQGKTDGENALTQARNIGQPPATPIYFAVEGLPNGYIENDLPGIRQYFEGVKQAIGTEYELGVYSDGLVCETLLDEWVCTYTWLSASKAFAGSRDFYRSGRWNLAQLTPLDQNWNGLSVDVNEAKNEFGAFTLAAPPSPQAFSMQQDAPAENVAAVGSPSTGFDDDPAAPADGEVSETAGFETGRVLANLGAPGAMEPVGPPAALAEAVSMGFQLARAQAFLDACRSSHPRVTYGLGKKVPFLGAVPGKDFKQVDCSGFVREAIRLSTNPPARFPDGSVVQHDWIRDHGFEKGTVRDGTLDDAAVRIAFLRPQDSPHGIGHIVLINRGMTLESHGGVGPDSRAWDGRGWQAKTWVYVLARGAELAIPTG